MRLHQVSLEVRAPSIAFPEVSLNLGHLLVQGGEIEGSSSEGGRLISRGATESGVDTRSANKAST
jgi:hypothetical protein